MKKIGEVATSMKNGIKTVGIGISNGAKKVWSSKTIRYGVAALVGAAAGFAGAKYSNK